jgi:PAS domain S-box-containing protein
MPTILRYGIAVLSVAIAIGLDFFLLRQFEAILTPFLFAVAATVWYAGTGPSALAIVLSVLSLNYFFLRPGFSFSPISYADLVYLTFCIFCALAVGWVSVVRRQTEQELRQARDEFEAKVLERTANLQRSESYLAETQKLTHTGSWAWDARSQTVLYCSEEMFRIYGLDPQVDLPTRKNFRQRVHPEDRSRTDARFVRVVNEKVDSFDEYRVLLPDGTVKHVISSGHPVLDENGEFVAFIGTATDVTERKRAEEALREREAKIRRLVDSNIIGIFITGLEGRILEANDAFLHLVGHDRDDLVSGRVRWTDLTPPEWRERDRRALKELSSNTIAQPYEKEFFRKDGSRVPVLIGGALFEEGGNEGVAFVLDLTERKRAEQALMRSEAYLAQALKLTRTGSWVWDPRTEKVLFCSEEMFRIFGLDPRESLPSRDNFRQQIHPEDRDRVKKKFEEALRERVDTFAEYRVLLPDGTVRHINASGHLVLNEDGELIEFVGTATDVTERKRTEEALRESEAKIRRLVDSNIIGIFVWDFDGRIVEANAEFLRMVNYDREDLVSGRIRWADLTPPDWRDRNSARIEQQKSSGRFEPFEKEYTRSDGSRLPVLIGGATFEEGGNQGVAFVLDLTERKCAEEALVRSEAYLAETQKLTHTGTWAWDARNQKVLFCSEEMFRIYGLDPQVDLPTRRNFRQRVHPEDRNRVDERQARVVNEKVGSSDEFRIVLPDGTVKHVSSSWHTILDGDGELIELIGTATDITERKRGEEALRESEHKLRQIIDTIPAHVVRYQPDGAADFMNQTFSEFLGPGVGFDNLSSVVHPEDYPKRSRDWDTHVAAAEPYDIEMRLRRADGVYRWHRSRRVPLRDANGAIVNWYGAGHDIDDQKRAEEAYREALLELAHANRVATMGQLTASITHEVNQPITAAVTYASAARRLLSAKPLDLHEVDDVLSLIVKEGNRAGEVVGRIRALIKKAPARKDDVEINDAILEVIALTRIEAANNSVSVRTQLAEGLPRVQGDRVQLQQVLLNLIINAIEAMRDGGEEERELIVSSRDGPDGVSVEVRDSGPGFAAADLDRVFEAFYSTKPSGLGLGLSICRSIIEAHDGRLWASPNVPRGAIFGFIAPAHPAAAS